MNHDYFHNKKYKRDLMNNIPKWIEDKQKEGFIIYFVTFTLKDTSYNVRKEDYSNFFEYLYCKFKRCSSVKKNHMGTFMLLFPETTYNFKRSKKSKNTKRRNEIAQAKQNSHCHYHGILGVHEEYIEKFKEKAVKHEYTYKNEKNPSNIIQAPAVRLKSRTINPYRAKQEQKLNMHSHRVIEAVRDKDIRNIIGYSLKNIYDSDFSSDDWLIYAPPPLVKDKKKRKEKCKKLPKHPSHSELIQSF